MPAYLKNPVFPPLEFVLDPSVPRMLEQDFGGMAVLEWTLKAGYMAEGVQVRVDKALTDEFLHVDLPSNVGFSDIPYPARFMEFFFEDPAFPTLLLGHLHPQTVTPRGGLDFAKYRMPIPKPTLMGGVEQQGESKDGSRNALCMVNLLPEHWKAVLDGEALEEFAMGQPLDSDEQSLVIRLISLAIQALMYASIEGHAPVPVTRKQMKAGGKPGVKGRPARQAVRIARQHALEGEGVSGHRKVSMHIRKGHFRFFSSPRFKAARGTFTYIAPMLVGARQATAKGARKES